MIFGKNAGLMLKYQKAKAKMVEYDVSKQEYPHFPLNSNELSYPTTYVLSRYSECIIENNHDELKELESLLITTAEYYDSAFKSKDRPEYDWDFLLSGASAYFLRKDFGKLVVEHALKNKYVSCVVCTSTLAQGVNIPIKYLLVTSIRNGLKLVKARDFQNLMGRTARAGIYTEGSIIITDCKIYDNRTNWKNGGRYLWNDCVKLFDTKLTEPCGSSILSLVQDFNIDYDVTVSGEKFIDIVIDHLDERDFLLDYAKKLEKAYLKVNPKRTQNLIVQEILLRQDIISNIENYLCLVRSAETLVNDSKKSAVDICTNTLAYAMATEKEKELLIKVFQKIEENIQQYSVEKLSRYSNAMSGIGLSSLIEEWIVQNELTEKIYTETELLYVITELYL